MTQENEKVKKSSTKRVKSSRGFVPSLFATARTEEVDFDKYDLKMAKKYLKKHESQTEVVDTMFRYSQRYAESMSVRKYEIIAAICIVQGVEYLGCDIWNERLANAMEYFLIKN